MMARYLAFGFCFSVAAVSGMVSGGCSSEECGALPSLPTGQARFGKVKLNSYDATGNNAALAFEVSQVSLEVTGSTVIIEYESDEVPHRVIYAVVPE